MKKIRIITSLLVMVICCGMLSVHVPAKDLTDILAAFAGGISSGDGVDEGIDTPVEIPEYNTYAGEHPDMFLKEGDHIALLAPSSLPAAKDVDRLVKGLSDWGYVPVKGKHILDEGRSLNDCIEDIKWALEDPEIKAIFCIRGGYGGSEVMDELSLELLENSGKLIIGYSDITVFHSAWTKASLPSIHSCMSQTFGNLKNECKEAEERILKGEIPVYKCKADSSCKTGEAEGILIGGNLSTFAAVIGTDYDCTDMDEPYILFLEDVEEDYSHIHRLLTILKHLGILENAAGIVFGEWTNIPTENSDYSGNSRNGDFVSVEDMISRQFLDEIKVPVAFGFPAGHGKVNYPLLMGEKVKLTVDPYNVTIQWIY